MTIDDGQFDSKVFINNFLKLTCMKRRFFFLAVVILTAIVAVCVIFSATNKCNSIYENVEALSEVENENNTCYIEYSSGIRMYVPICDPRVPTGTAIPCEPPFFQKVLDYRNCY